MRDLYKVILTIVFINFLQHTNAQDDYKPWALSVGVNAVDYFPVGQPDPQGDLFDEFFNATDHWNIIPLTSWFKISRHWKNRFSFSVAASFNEIKKFGTNVDSATGLETTNIVDDLTYYALDGSINYSFTDSRITKIEPYIGAGGGYTWLNTIGSGTLNGSLGIRYWFTDRISFNIESTYKHVFEDYAFRHFQHSASITYKFGGEKDTDKDGINDSEDGCPDLPGLLENNGCPDTDKDGIPDSNDRCPNIPGLSDFDGCPDTDKDGVPDSKDQCPNIAGVAALNGCPDADNDGITDSRDKCPTVAGPRQNNGCPYTDSDGDGISDRNDKCPNEAGPRSNNGCKVFTKKEETLLNEYARVILFSPNRAEIKNESKTILQDIITILKNNTSARFTINGYTDSVGATESNFKLSEERALAVKNYLILNGINPNRLTSKGYGEANPIAPNTNIQGRRKNRRVEIVLIN